jgi:hypothetical protein
VTSLPRMTLSSSPVVVHAGQVRVCNMVTGGECLISAWNLCSNLFAPLDYFVTVDVTSFYVKLKVSLMVDRPR